MKVPPTFWLLLLLTAGCTTAGEEKYAMSDAALHLSSQQATGRRIYNGNCLHCHEAYTSKRRNGLSLRGIYARPFLPSGLPVNDGRVAEVIMRGKRMMPPTPLTDEQLQDLLSYLRTL